MNVMFRKLGINREQYGLYLQPLTATHQDPAEWKYYVPPEGVTRAKPSWTDPTHNISGQVVQKNRKV